MLRSVGRLPGYLDELQWSAAGTLVRALLKAYSGEGECGYAVDGPDTLPVGLAHNICALPAALVG